MKYKIVAIIAYIPLLATVISSLYLYHKIGKALKALSWFIFLSGVIQFTSLCFFYRRMNNLPLLHIYTAGGFFCLAWFYRMVLGNFIHKYIIWGTTLLFVLFCITDTIFIEPILTFNTYALMAEAVLVIILSLFTFIYLLDNRARESGIGDIQSISWINSGLFIYFLSCFLIYYFANIIKSHFTLPLRRIAWMFHAFFSTVMYTCFLIGLWKREKIQD